MRASAQRRSATPDASAVAGQDSNLQPDYEPDELPTAPPAASAVPTAPCIVHNPGPLVNPSAPRAGRRRDRERSCRGWYCLLKGLNPVEVIKISPRLLLRRGRRDQSGQKAAKDPMPKPVHFGRHRAQPPRRGGAGALRHCLAGRRRPGSAADRVSEGTVIFTAHGVRPVKRRPAKGCTASTPHARRHPHAGQRAGGPDFILYIGKRGRAGGRHRRAPDRIPWWRTRTTWARWASSPGGAHASRRGRR